MNAAKCLLLFGMIAAALPSCTPDDGSPNEDTPVTLRMYKGANH